ncbi:hypothetical protein [Granulicella rosea]|uniref:hypothetical protein n=1 Tax=Granulicella rosea TaxID=474952 RepID=UPI00115C76F6|nr:hypothetical protein [Granulicella rosea]
MVIGASLAAAAQAPARLKTPVLPASEFRVTVSEEPASRLPPFAKCTGDAAETLNCRVFTVKLTNLGSHAVWLGGTVCQPVEITFERQVRGQWNWIGGEPQYEACKQPAHTYASSWTNVRLAPGESTTHTGRMLFKGDAFAAYPYAPGATPMRARWKLRGCLEGAPGVNCIEALETAPWPPPIWANEWTSAVSEPFTVVAPPLPQLEAPKLEISLTAEMMDPAKGLADQPEWLSRACRAETAGSMDCVLLRYRVRNTGLLPVSVGHMTCSDESMWPEYRRPGDADWKSPGMKGYDCTMNYMKWDRIDPGSVLEGETIPRFAGAGVDIHPIRAAGAYQIRLSYAPEICVLSVADGFCLTQPQRADKAVSNGVTIRTTAALAEH